jgi:hypothetical protein
MFSREHSVFAGEQFVANPLPVRSVQEPITVH